MIELVLILMVGEVQGPAVVIPFETVIECEKAAELLEVKAPDKKIANSIQAYVSCNTKQVI